MIPAILAQSVHHALTARPRADQSAASSTPASIGAVKGSDRSAEAGGSIASDIGRLTTDALTMLGLGGSGPTSSGRQAAQAYAATSTEFGAVGQ